MPAPDQISTIHQLLDLPDDGRRHELLDGRHVITPKQGRHHQSAIRGLLKMLSGQMRMRPDLDVMISPSEVKLGPRTLVQPDLFVVKQDPARPIQTWADVGVPVLAVEVLSPDTADRDRGVKREIYLDAGVREYWMVDLDGRLVERWRPLIVAPDVERKTLWWSLLNDVAGKIDLSEFFAQVLRED